MNAPLTLKDRIAETSRKPGTHLPAFNSVALEVQKLIIDQSVLLARIESALHQALTRVGAQQVIRLVLAAALESARGLQRHRPRSPPARMRHRKRADGGGKPG